MKAHVRSLIFIVKEKRKQTEEEEDLISSLAVYSRKVEMAIQGGVYFRSSLNPNFGSLSGIVCINWQSPGMLW
jgi:hypothetical protein